MGQVVPVLGSLKLCAVSSCDLSSAPLSMGSCWFLTELGLKMEHFLHLFKIKTYLAGERHQYLVKHDI